MIKALTLCAPALLFTVLGAGFVLPSGAAGAQPAGITPRVRMDPENPQSVQVFTEGKWRTIGRFDAVNGRFAVGESPETHGADGRCTRGSNDTAAVQAFLNAVRDGGTGTLAGCYIVDEGKLTLTPSPDAPLVTTGAWQILSAPLITGNAKFVGSGKGTGPFLKIANHMQTSGNGRFYGGGSLGNITFENHNPRASAANAGLFIQGLVNWRFGQLMGQSLGGSLLELSGKTVNGNPDAYGSISNEFVGLVCTSCKRPVAEMGSLTDSGQKITFVGAYGDGPTDRSISNGALASGGQGTVITGLSALGTRGWAVTYGVTDIGNRQISHAMELHATENGLWVAALYNSSLRGRINFDRLGNGPVWPLTAIKIGGLNKSVRQVDIDFQIRLDGATTLADITRNGTLIDLSNDPNLVDVTIRLTISGNPAAMPFTRDGALSVPVDLLVKNRARWAGVTVIINGNTIVTPLK